jgi:hypothetical protein
MQVNPLVPRSATASENPIPQVWRQAPLRDNFNLDAPYVLQLVAKCDKIEQASAVGHFDEQIQVARAIRLTAPNRPNRRTFRAP